MKRDQRHGGEGSGDAVAISAGVGGDMALEDGDSADAERGDGEATGSGEGEIAAHAPFLATETKSSIRERGRHVRRRRDRDIMKTVRLILWSQLYRGTSMFLAERMAQKGSLSHIEHMLLVQCTVVFISWCMVHHNLSVYESRA